MNRIVGIETEYGCLSLLPPGSTIGILGGGQLGRILGLSTDADYSSRYGGELALMAVTMSATRGGDQTEITAPSVTVRATVYGR